MTTLGSQIGNHIRTAQTLHNGRSKSIELLENETGSRPWIARAPPDTVLPCHVASYGMLNTHATVVSMLRLLAIAYVGKNAIAVKQRADTLDAIVEELDLLE